MSHQVEGPLDPNIFTICTEISCKISVTGKQVRISFSGIHPAAYDESLYQALRLRIFLIYKAHQRIIPPLPGALSFHFALYQGDQKYAVQCLLKEDACRLFLYPPGQGLPELFGQQEEHRALAEKKRIRELLEQGLIQDDVFALYYQPIIQIDSSGVLQAIRGAEAFMRVKDRGDLRNPREYLDVAEEDPLLMRKLGYKILELACSDLKVFKTKYPLFTMSLNVSEQQFARFDDAISFERIFASVKEQYEVERHDIALEVPEVSADAATDSAAMLKRLFDDGTPIILDNFTLGALMSDSVVEIDKYKIPGQMLQDSFHGTGHKQHVAKDFLRRVFGTARKYHKSVVVKGVETFDQVPFLLEHGYSVEDDLIQGNAYCPPMDLASFESIYKDNVTRLYRSHLIELFRQAHVRVLYQKSQMLIDICSYFKKKRLTSDIGVAQSFSELWTTNDRDLVVIMGYDFISFIVSPDQLKDEDHAEEIWERLLQEGSLFEIPGLSMAMINNFQDKDRIAQLFEMVEEYDGHNLYQILITINKEKTEKIPFIILSQNDTHLQHLEENVIILNNLDNLEKFEDSFVDSIFQRPEAIAKFKRF